jgi:hypothetical protein
MVVFAEEPFVTIPIEKGQGRKKISGSDADPEKYW